jgi:16S rRNA G527 N7-methylase RsmG
MNLEEACRRAARELGRRLEASDGHWPGRDATLAALREGAGESALRYLELLQRWSRSQRLTGWKTADDRLRRGIVPSWAGAVLLAPGERWMDSGSGAGLPGAALAMLGAGAGGWLVESRRKRAAFLAEVRRRLELGSLHVHHGRLERTLPPGWEGGPPVLVARAFARPGSVLEIAAELRSPAVLMWLGASDAEGVCADPPPGWDLAGQVPGSLYGDSGAIVRMRRVD